MTDTVQSLEREIAALDKEFDSPENIRTGRLKQPEYQSRQKALNDRLHEAKLAERKAERVAQARRPASSSRPYLMPADDVKQLRQMERGFDEASEAGDIGTMVATYESEDFRRLTWLNEREHAAEHGGTLYDATLGARVTLLVKVLAIAASRRLALEKRVAELESAVPKYVGVYRSGETYAKNSIATHSGAMWIALQETDKPPPGNGWQLCVQKGRDAR